MQGLIEGEPDVDEFIFVAVVQAIEMTDQMAISMQHFEEVLDWGEKLYFKNNNATDNNAYTMWPSDIMNFTEQDNYSCWNKERAFFFPRMPVLLTEKFHCHLFARLNIYHHIYNIAHMPHIDIQILALCRMFVT